MNLSTIKQCSAQNAPAWLGSLRAYLVTIAVANLIWETLHIPLYTIWRTGTVGEQVFAVLHCTLGDILIALTTLVLALLVIGKSAWPADRAWPVAALSIAFGVTYTIFSEWLNVSVRSAWAYSEYMPVISVGGLQIGASPLLQWIVVPALATWVAVRRG